jgi:hypothetical protein
LRARCRPPAAASSAAATSASAVDSAANLAVSPCASGPTAAAESAEVAVVALTTSVRDVPSHEYASSAPGAAARPADGGSPAICAYATACGTTTLQIDHAGQDVGDEPGLPVPARPRREQPHVRPSLFSATC